MTFDDPRQSAAGQNPDADHADTRRLRMIEETAIILCREICRHAARGRGVEHIVNHLRAIEEARVDDLLERVRVSDGGKAEELHLALPPQPVERGHHLVEHLPNAQRFLPAFRRDRVVQIKDAHALEAEASQASFQRFGNGVADATEVLRRQSDLGAHNDARGSQLGEHSAEMGLGRAIAVLHGGVEIIHTRLERLRDGAFLFGGITVYHQPPDRAAAEAEDRDRQPGAAEYPHLH